MAKVDIRESDIGAVNKLLDGSNVLRRVICPATAEVAVKIRKETPEVHYLKVQPLCEEGRKEVPVLRLKGMWLREAGIVQNQYVSVTVLEGLLLIRSVRSEVE